MQLKELLKKTNKEYHQICNDISRDIKRTFHFGRFLTEEGLTDFQNLLELLAYNNTEIDYCQGMNFVAGVFLELFDNTKLAFLAFQSLLNNYDIFYLYIKVLITQLLSICQTMDSECIKLIII